MAKAQKKVEQQVYKGHRLGSRKGLVHMVFDEKGRDAAVKYGVKQDLKESTLVQWCRAWARGDA